MMDGPRGAVPTLGGGAGVVHGTTLVGAAGRGSLVWIVGCVDVMAPCVPWGRFWGVLLVGRFVPVSVRCDCLS